MRAVIMAGGRGTRVASVDGSVPKPMLRIDGKPVLQHQIECLARQEVRHITLAIGYLGDTIRNYFGNGHWLGVEIDYIQEEAPLGTAGALYYLKGKISEDFFLINGDLIFDVDLKRLIKYHRMCCALVTVLVHPNEHPFDSTLITADNSGRIIRWSAKEEREGWQENCVNAGIHVLSPELLENWGELRKLDLDRQVLKPLIPSGRLYAYHSPEYVKDMGTVERIAAVGTELRSGLVGKKNLSRKQYAVFLDRDGTINRYVGFLRDINEFALVEGAAKAIRRLNQNGYLVIVVTNQPVIARGELTWDQLNEIHCKMETLLGEEGAYVDDIFICPHHPERGFPGERPEYKVSCDCRKPKPGLLLRAAEKYNIDLAESWMIGDGQVDIEAGQAAGCRTIRISEEFTLEDAVRQICVSKG